MQILFYKFEKPRHAVIPAQDPKGRKNTRVVVCYMRGYLVHSLPMVNAISYLPGIGRLFLLAYAPRVHIGEHTFQAGFLYDPDLTEIGNHAVIGGGTVVSGHSMTIKGPGEYVYVSAKVCIGNAATIGGESRIAMGVSIGDYAVVEPASNVTAFTIIPPGEVWGGNPAVFLRKRVDAPVQNAEANSRPTHSKAEAQDLNFDVRTAAARVVADTFAITNADADELGEEAVGEWDSLAKLAIAASLADVYDCRLSPQQILELKSLSDVEQAIASARSRGVTAAVESSAELPTDPEWLPLLPSNTVSRLLANERSPAAPLPSRCSVTIAASFTAEPLASSLTRWSSAFGIETEVQFCGFNQIIQRCWRPTAPFANAAGLNVVLLRPEDLPETPAEAAAMMSDVLGAIRRFTSDGTGLVVGSLPPPISSSFGGDRVQTDALRSRWSQELTEIEGVEIIDFAGAIERVGLAAAGDAALEAATRAPYSPAAFRELGIEMCGLFAAAEFPRRKFWRSTVMACYGAERSRKTVSTESNWAPMVPDEPSNYFSGSSCV